MSSMSKAVLDRFAGGVEVRQAKDLDARACAELYWLMCEEEAALSLDTANFPVVFAWFREMLEGSNPAVLVTESEGRVVGMLMLANDQPGPLEPPRVMAFSLFVHPRHRDGHAALALIKTAVAVAEAVGAALECIVEPDSTNARLYEEIGAHLTGAIYRLEASNV